MRERFHDLCEKARVGGGRHATGHGERVGAFLLKHPNGSFLWAIANDDSEWDVLGLPRPAWEHVSVHVRHPTEPSPLRTPTWEELCWVKGLFWGEEECVIQFHPPKSRYVNNHPFTLHLWKPVGVEIPMPPMECV